MNSESASFFIEKLTEKRKVKKKIKVLLFFDFSVRIEI